jgi:hypothetical protein
MISAQTLCACREGNRYTLFRILLWQILVAVLSSQIRIAGAADWAWNINRQSCIVWMLRWEKTTMRWKISPHGHDSRQVDLLAVIALVIIILAAWRYFGESPEPPSSTAFIVPSQSTHW